MIRITLITIQILLLIAVKAQTTETITYGYDKNGNCTGRTSSLLIAKAATDTETDETINTSTGQPNLLTPNNYDTQNNVTDTVSKPNLNWQPSVNEQFGNFNIKLYPNPTQANIIIEINGSSTNLNQGFVTIFDVNGRVLINVNNISNYNSIDLSNLPNAMYLLKLNINNKATTWHIVKQ